nr:ubiquitin carboxyl-terminal hydrolase 15-like [Ipomoea batatas]GME08601.1 ubiquitin carboxyl-terminal hydrolase 15-like [Ipomoea batatas]
MLQPSETDVLALFLFLVVLPLVIYIFLGKWNEAAKKKGRASVLAQQAAEEAFRVEAMAAANVFPPVPVPVPLPSNSLHQAASVPSVPLPNTSLHECARCYGPATTRCSRCKSVRYCSGKCQILHWREIHKQECQLLENNSNISSPKSALMEELPGRVSVDSNMSAQFVEYNSKQPKFEKDPSDHIIQSPISTPSSTGVACASIDPSESPLRQRRSIERRASRKGNKDAIRKAEGNILEGSDQSSRSRVTSSTSCCTIPSSEPSTRNKFRESDSMLYEQYSVPGGDADNKSTMQNSYMSQRQSENDPWTRNYYASSDAPNLESHETNAWETQVDTSNGDSILSGGLTSQDITAGMDYSCEMGATRKINKSKPKVSRDEMCSDQDGEGKKGDELRNAKIKESIPSNGRNGIMKMFGLMKSSRPDRQAHSLVKTDKHKKLKMLFPYEEFVKYFQYEVLNVSPRGLINCGNSCYANAVLQCLTFTKPLTVYLLHRSHSRTCCGRDWCLMCELEQHVMMLRESGEPLSPNRFLLRMQSINSQIGNGSQEDAHEFLRLLVASMQSICLEGLGGEKAIEPRLQETTFIQHIFGGQLRSKVKCLRCHHESECYENIMDLTLEIYGWVESLEDALTQFTSPEDLDGENMYRCGSCSSYVRAQKQLSIQEAPNILTIVLKRFQGGCYGKINKCITFPEMLDMIPYMTGTDDVPPLYMLYAVVVHLDTLNASFSGHYISYVKDMQGNWFRIDDTKVQQVPMSRVMTEGAYILFYMRSSPRPDRTGASKSTRHLVPGISKHSSTKSQKPSRPEQIKASNHFACLDRSRDHRLKTGVDVINRTSGSVVRNANRNRPPIMGTYSENMEMSDATASDWSLFTSSDEASFTTESTRDSFSTVDYSDASTLDPFSSFINTMSAPDYNSKRTIACSMFSGTRPHTSFFSENKGFVVDSHLGSVQGGDEPMQVSVVSPPSEAFFVDRHVNYGYESRYVAPQTYYDQLL